MLRAAELAGVYVPSLCSHKELSPFGGCRLCSVEIEGSRGYPLACNTPATEGMAVTTDTVALREMREEILRLILSEHPCSCLLCGESDDCRRTLTTIRKAGVSTGCRSCPNDGDCELQNLVERLGIDDVGYPIVYRGLEAEHDDPFYDRDYNLCILCGRCVRMCHEVRGASVLAFKYRGPRTQVGPAFGLSHVAAGCEFCGACVSVCPTGALADKVSKWDGKPDGAVTSTCPFCCLGCRVELAHKDGALSSVGAAHDVEVNDGQLCVRGRFCLPEVTHHYSRVRKPMLRKGPYDRVVTWDEALDVGGGRAFRRRSRRRAAGRLARPDQRGHLRGPALRPPGARGSRRRFHGRRLLARRAGVLVAALRPACLACRPRRGRDRDRGWPRHPLLVLGRRRAGAPRHAARRQAGGRRRARIEPRAGRRPVGAQRARRRGPRAARRAGRGARRGGRRHAVDRRRAEGLRLPRRRRVAARARGDRRPPRRRCVAAGPWRQRAGSARARWAGRRAARPTARAGRRAESRRVSRRAATPRAVPRRRDALRRTARLRARDRPGALSAALRGRRVPARGVQCRGRRDAHQHRGAGPGTARRRAPARRHGRDGACRLAHLLRPRRAARSARPAVRRRGCRAGGHPRRGRRLRRRGRSRAAAHGAAPELPRPSTRRPRAVMLRSPAIRRRRPPTHWPAVVVSSSSSNTPRFVTAASISPPWSRGWASCTSKRVSRCIPPISPVSESRRAAS